EDGKKGLIWLPRSDFDSSWVILMREDLAKNLNIQTISDLARYTNQENVEIEFQSMKFAINEEFLRREDGVKRLNEVYGFSIKDENVLAVENNLLSQAVKESRVQVAVGWVADSRIKKYQLTTLEDDRNVFPPYHVAPIIKKETRDSHPEIEKLLDKISKKVNNEVMIDLTYKVEVLHQDVFFVAREFLKENNLLKK
ncbi:glycine betaine ABC transporter substrate-binding protein, partial [Ammoniphilus sp. 3BR4]|uniref:ABC transporter substrate-binding protein n=1 Tax=Ammoniphilus sp. 3BR4 TaxID=3158265 RepID=UPI003467540D